MAAPPAIAGTYADLRQVKSRGVWQLVIDVPAEQVEAMVDLFGMPRQDKPTHLAVARLKEPPGTNGSAATQASAAPADPPHPPEGLRVPGGAKRERTLPEKVGMRCGNAYFQAWLMDHLGLQQDAAQTVDEIAEIVRQRCGVKSRTEILPGTEAAAKWLALETRFLEDTGQMAERR